MAITFGKTREDGSRDCTFTGWVTRDAKFEYTANTRTPKVSFGVGVGNQRYLNCTALGDSPLTNLAVTLTKDTVVSGGGKFTVRKYTGSDGKEKTSFDVLLDCIIPMPAAAASTSQQTPESQQDSFTELEDDDELPF